MILELTYFLWNGIIYRIQCSPTDSQTNYSFESILNIEFTVILCYAVPTILRQIWTVKEPESVRNRAQNVSIETVFTTVNTKAYSNYLFDSLAAKLTKSSVCTCFTKLFALDETKLNCYIWKRPKSTVWMLELNMPTMLHTGQYSPKTSN